MFAEAGDARVRAVDWIALGIVLVVALALRLYRLDFQSFWFDEILSYLASSGSIRDVIFDPVANTRIPPLYYVLVHPLMASDNKELWLRLPSVLLGVASIAVLYAIATAWLDRRVALLAAAFVAASPFHVWYSQEHRPYSLLLLLILVSIWFFDRVRRRPEAVGPRVGFIVATAATFYCHTVSATFIALLGVLVLLLEPRQRWWRWAIDFGAVAVLLLPAVVLMSSYEIAPAAPAKSAASAAFFLGPYLVWSFGTGYSLGPSLTALHQSDRMAQVLAHAWLIVPVGLGLGLLTLYGAWRVIRRGREPASAVLAWFLVPVGLGIAASLLPGETFNVRYAIAAFPAFALLVATGIRHLGPLPLRALCIVLLLAVDAAALRNYYFVGEYQREDNRGAGDFLAAHAEESELVLSSAGYVRLALEHYAGRDDLKFVELDRGNRESLRQLRALASDRTSLWLFLSRSYHGDPDGKVPRLADELGTRDLEFSSHGVELIRYRLGPAPRDEPQSGEIQM